MITSREDFLMTVLHCGICDLSLLDDIKYDMFDLLAEVDYMKVSELNINTLVRLAVECGVRDIEEARDDRICELEAIENERDLEEDEETELKALRELEPEEDIASYHNYIDTNVWFEKNAQTYREYLPDALREFCENVGYEIGG